MNDQYSAWTGLLYVFNVIVGTGALTLPKAFSQAGWVFSSVLMIVLSFISYVTVTFVIEAMSACNAISQWTKLEKMKRVSRYLREAINQAEHSSNEDLVTVTEEATTSRTTLLPSECIDDFPSEPQKLFTLDRRIEMGEMADVVFGKLGRILFYICICLYLYGDMTIYSASIAKTLLDTTCTQNTTVSTEKCWETYDLTQWGVYRMYLVFFLIVMGPFAFFNVQKTKYLQVCTSVTRWLALLVMISLAIVKVSRGDTGTSPAVAVPSALPSLLGSTVYSFMCHHSLPSMLSPIKDKRRLSTLLALDYFIILTFYLTLSITAVFAFPHIQDLYTLNFEPKPGDPAFMEVVDYFLALFPVFTLTATFPIIAVTLRNNLQALFSDVESQLFHKVFLPIVAVVPPVVLASITQNIEILVGITGSFAGVGIEYIIPALLVVLSRTRIPEPISLLPNQFKSPFKSQAWPFVVIGWALLSIVLVTFNIINSSI